MLATTIAAHASVKSKIPADLRIRIPSASCEPPKGVPDVPSVLAALSGVEAQLFVVVEQDMYPVHFDVPAPVAARTRDYLRAAGVGG